jgi:Na+/melibiose symporter-like transporter
MFNLCITCENSPEWARFIYYAPFVVIFQFGWAATQISHLSLIPQLTTNDNERVSLNAIRYAFTVMSNLFVYAMTYLLLRFSDSFSDDTNDLAPADSSKFMHLTFIMCGVGLVFQVIFHVGTNEKNLQNDQEIMDQGNGISSYSHHETLDWYGYLKCYRFYTVLKKIHLSSFQPFYNSSNFSFKM